MGKMSERQANIALYDREELGYQYAKKMPKKKTKKEEPKYNYVFRAVNGSSYIYDTGNGKYTFNHYQAKRYNMSKDAAATKAQKMRERGKYDWQQVQV